MIAKTSTSRIVWPRVPLARSKEIIFPRFGRNRVGCRGSLGPSREKKLIQFECKHRNRSFDAHLGATQLIEIVPRRIGTLDGRGGRTIAASSQDGHCGFAAVC